MREFRRADERGVADLGWLNSRHSLSFGQYYDRRHRGFPDLRVINDDRVKGGEGFLTHPHRDMEVFTYGLVGPRNIEIQWGAVRSFIPATCR